MLGALLLANGTNLDRIAGIIEPEHFAHETHGRIYEAMTAFRDRGEPANPVTLRRHFEADTALSELGGASYLVKIAAASSTPDIAATARSIRSLALRRQMVEASEEIKADALTEDFARTDEQRLEEAEARIAAISAGDTSAKGVRALPATVDDHVEAVERAWRAGGKSLALPTGLASLDRVIDGWQPGLLYLLGGRPGMGKSQLAGVMSSALSRHSGVVVFSLEMTAQQWVARWLAALTGISTQRQRRGEMTENEWLSLLDARDAVKALSVHIDDTGRLSVAQIARRCHRIARRRPLGLVVVDHLQLVRSSKEAARHGDTSIITEISGDLKALAKSLNVALLAVCQLNRAVESRENKRPTLADLRSSGSLEQDADVVMLAYRHAYYVERDRPQRKSGEGDVAFSGREADYRELLSGCEHDLEIDIVKQRDGRTGLINLYFDGETSRITDLVG